LSEGNFTYTTNGTNRTITGFKEYTGTRGAVAIPATIGEGTVTAIGNDAFKNETLTAVTLPNSLRSIGDHAFEGNMNLTAVNIPTAVTTIGGFAFAGCRNMTGITLPNSLTIIGGYAFQSCDKLNNVIIPGSVTSLGENAFQQCISLTSITLPNGLSKIESSTFWFCENLTTITIPSGVNKIESNAFLNCSKLASVYFLGNTRPTIGGDAFEGIAFGAKGYYPATASVEWSGISGLSLEPKVYNQLINGSFEDGPAKLTGGNLLTDQNDVLGWETTASDGLIELWYSGFLGSSGNDGNTLAELNANGLGSLYQDVTMTVNSPVSYSFLHRGRAGNDEMVFKIDELSGGPGTSVAETKFTLPVTTGTSWVRYSGSQATTVEAGKTYRFSYTSVKPTNGTGNLLDDASFGIDQDGDGLLDYEELALGTDPLDFDSDMDGFWDGVEVTAGTNPKQTSSSPKPVLTVQPASITKTSGEGVTFSVTATNPAGSPSALTYQWYKDGTIIPARTNSTLIISPLTIVEAGNYSVVVSNLYGAATSNIATLTVNKATPTITALPGFMSATGGTKSGSGDFIIHTFTNVGNSTFTPTGSGTVEILVVAGGGGAGFDGGGGGGAGGVITNTVSVTAGTNYSVVVGSGGMAASGPTWEANGSPGSNSQFGSITAIGGAGGYNGHARITAITTGGSGGGQGFIDEGVDPIAGPGNGTPGQGNQGGYSFNGSAGGGGGGAGAAGGDASDKQGGNGGNGIQSGISGVATWYGGGGAGGSWDGTGGTGGMGGGGNGGGDRPATAGANGIANTGGGGGGNGYASSSDSGNGGSGIVIVRYKPKILTYGQLSGDATFSGATASVPGSFAFANPSAAVGTSSLSVIFTPNDTDNYNTATRSVSVTVTKATPTISVIPTATPIAYGQALASSTLSGGSASVTGTFTFTTPSTVPSVGTAPQSVTFTPNDTNNYNTETASVSVTVNQALISSGFSHTLYLGAGATSVTAWGLNTDGRLGVGDMDSPVNWAEAVDGDFSVETVTGLAAGGTHSLILANGKVYAAGSDRFGQLGQGGTSRINQSSFIQVFAPTSRVVAVSAGGNHSLAVTELGDVYACGDNTYGQLGNSTLVSSATWIKVSIQYPSTGLSPKIVSVVAGADHNLAVDEGGGVWVWGRNNYGQLGKGSRSVAERTPVQIISSGAKSAAAGFSHSLILTTTDGKVLGFGRNNSGQTGQSATSSVVLVPAQISGLSGIRLISAGTDSSFAINQTGRLYSWGYNSYGELLLGYSSPSSSPAVYGPRLSPIATNVFNVSGGGYSSLAVGAQGVIFGGRNDVGQAGNGPDPDEVVGYYYNDAGSLALTNLTMDLAGTIEDPFYDQIFVGKGAVTLNGILNLMFVGTYTGPVFGTPQTFDLIWAKNGITLGTDYRLAFNQSGYWAETERVAQDGGEVLRATVGAVVTAADLAQAVQTANPVLHQVQSVSYKSTGLSSLSLGSEMEMIYSYERPTGGVTSGAEYFVGGTTYRVQQGSSVSGPWSNASVSGTTVTPLGNGRERVTLRISASGSAGYLQLVVTPPAT
jgi:alpha-tubulin suppressor-like RCC1 family protein